VTTAAVGDNKLIYIWSYFIGYKLKFAGRALIGEAFSVRRSRWKSVI